MRDGVRNGVRDGVRYGVREKETRVPEREKETGVPPMGPGPKPGKPNPRDA